MDNFEEIMNTLADSNTHRHAEHPFFCQQLYLSCGHLQSHGKSCSLLWFGGGLQQFILQCSLVLEMQPHKLPLKELKLLKLLTG